MFVCMVLLAVFKCNRLGRNYISWQNFFNFIVTILTGACCFLLLPYLVDQDDTGRCLQWSLEVGHLLILFSTMNLILKLGDFPHFGNVVHCALEVLSSLTALIIAYILPLLMAFGFFYHIRIDTQSRFDLQDLITRPLSMMIGINISVKDFMTPAEQVTTHSVQCVLIIFICLMCILSC